MFSFQREDLGGAKGIMRVLVKYRGVFMRQRYWAESPTGVDIRSLEDSETGSGAVSPSPSVRNGHNCDSNTAGHSRDPTDGGTEGDNSGEGTPGKVLPQSWSLRITDLRRQWQVCTFGMVEQHTASHPYPTFTATINSSVRFVDVS